MISELYDYLSDNYTEYCEAKISISAKNHLAGFAAKKYRPEDTVDDMDECFNIHGLVND